MTFDEVFKETAQREGITFKKARSVILTALDVVKHNVLEKRVRVVFPQFGVFFHRATKPARRLVAGNLVDVQKSIRVAFRPSTGAKSSE